MTISVGPHIGRHRGACRIAIFALALATLVTTTLTTEAALASSVVDLPALADPCPAAVPSDEIGDLEGQVLTGLTVERGTAPDEFTAEYIGVIKDGIAPGLDMILVETSSPAIERAGGIWFGMSGSPVYDEAGRLVGAVAYGLSYGASPIAGITPATEMYRLLTGGGPAAQAPQVDLPAALEAEIVASGAATAAQAASGLRQLQIPIAVSGMNQQRLPEITKRIQGNLSGVRVYPAGAASGEAAVAELVAGGNVGAAVSYGDASLAGVGTVTAVCDGEALLFGHPLLWSGATTLSAHEATAVLIQPDPFGPFKIANLGGVTGTVDQDRLSALRTQLGVTPPTALIKSTLSATDSGASRTGSTRVVLRSWTPDVAFFHTLSNLDRLHDRIGDGVVTLRWSASGKRADGSTWQFTRREKTADVYDATFAPAYEIYDDLITLATNRFEEITIDQVSMSGTVDPKYTAARLVALEKLGANGRWTKVDPAVRTNLVAGAEVYLRAVLRTTGSTKLTRVQMSFVAPRAGGNNGTLRIKAGTPEWEPGNATSFDELVAEIAKAPPGDLLRADLRVNRTMPSGDRTVLTRHSRKIAPMAISGDLSFRIRIVPATR